MIPRLKPWLGKKELRAAFSRSKGDDVRKFEKTFAREVGQKHAVAFPYGRTGLIFLLNALNLRGKEIICPAYTCVVVPHAITYSGNRPVFVDSQPSDFNMDLDRVPDAVNENTGAIIATSIFGYPVDLDKLNVIRKTYPHIHIIQDCAHSFSAEWKGTPVQKHGVAAVYGLNISKLITSIFGGMITTDDEALADTLRYQRSKCLKTPGPGKTIRRLLYLLAIYPTFSNWVYGFINRLERSGLLDLFVKYYDEGKIDMPSDYLEQMTNLEARVGLVQLKKYRQIIDRRRALASYYNQTLFGIKGLKLPPLVEGATYSHYVPMVEDRNRFLDFFLKQGVQLGWLIEYCIPHMSSYGQKQGGAYCIAAKMSESAINIPLFSGIGNASIERIVDLFKQGKAL